MEEEPLSGNYNGKEEDHQGGGFQRKSNAMFKLTRGGLIKEDEGEDTNLIPVLELRIMADQGGVVWIPIVAT